MIDAAEVAELTRCVEARAMVRARGGNGWRMRRREGLSGAAKARGEVLIDNPPEQSKHQKIDGDGIAIISAIFTHILVSETESVRIPWLRRHLLPNGGPEMT